MAKQQYTKQELMQLAYNTAIKYGVAPDVVLGIIDKETGGSWNPNSKNYSKIEKSQGLMQINIDAHPDYKGGYDPVQNIEYGVKLLSNLLKANGGDYNKAVARYNGSGSQAREYAKDVMLNRATKYDKKLMNTLAANSSTSPLSSQGLMDRMQGQATGAAAPIPDSSNQISLPRVDEELGLTTTPQQMYDTMTDVNAIQKTAKDAYDYFASRPLPQTVKDIMGTNYGAGVQDYANAYNAQIQNLNQAVTDQQTAQALSQQDLLQRFQGMRDLVAQDPRLQNQGYYLDPRVIQNQARGQAALAAYGINPNLVPSATDIARQQYETRIANQYGVPYQDYMQSRLEQIQNNLGISQGEIQYLASRAAAGDTLAQQQLQALTTAGTNYMTGLQNAGKLDATNANTILQYLLSGDNSLRQEALKAFANSNENVQGRVKDLLTTLTTAQGGVTQEGIKSDTSENVANITGQTQRDVANIYGANKNQEDLLGDQKTLSQIELNKSNQVYNLRSAGIPTNEAYAMVYGNNPNVNAVDPIVQGQPIPTQQPTPQQAVPVQTNQPSQGQRIFDNVVQMGYNYINPAQSIGNLGVSAGNAGLDLYNRYFGNR